MKVGIIGAGMVGGATANALMLTGAADEGRLAHAGTAHVFAPGVTCGRGGALTSIAADVYTCPKHSCGFAFGLCLPVEFLQL